MAPTCNDDTENLLPWIREIRGQEQLNADPIVLEEARQFLRAHEAETARDATHMVLENYPDWWCKGRRAPPGLCCENEQDIEDLYRHAGTLFGLGVPLTLAEKRTPIFRFFQDVEAWGNRDSAVPVEELFGPECPLAHIVGKIIGEVFPNHGGFLDAAIYDSTGLSQTKGVKKTSIRLVWPGVVVDADRAARVRDLVVHRLTAVSTEAASPIAELEARLSGISSQNAWHSVFGDAAYSGRSSVRMPCSDRVSPLPLRAPEKRPLAPIGVLRFSYNGDKMKVEWLCTREELDYSEWIKIGCLRQGPEALLTEWSVPSWTSTTAIPPSASRTGRVKVRTAGGSDAGSGLARRGTRATTLAPEQQGQLLTVERRFMGTPDQFSEQMEKQLGKSTVEADGTIVWKQPDGDARIVMYAEDRRVRVIGRPNQVRSLVVIVSPYTEALPAGNFGNTDRAATAPTGKNGPGAAFAPADENAPQAKSTSEEKSEEAPVVEDKKCVVKQVFEAQSQGELGLKIGEVVRITHDPEGERENNVDRWVHGVCEATEESGWFPLSHTVPEE